MSLSLCGYQCSATSSIRQLWPPCKSKLLNGHPPLPRPHSSTPSIPPSLSLTPSLSLSLPPFPSSLMLSHPRPLPLSHPYLPWPLPPPFAISLPSACSFLPLHEPCLPPSLHPPLSSASYEGRCGMPTLFDATYCYSLGHTAGALLQAGETGLIASVSEREGRRE